MGFFSLLILIVLTGIYIVTCLFMIAVVLMQEGKGGGLSGLVSGAASPLSDVMGAHDAEATLRSWTKWAAITFLILTIILTVFGPALMGGGQDEITEGLDSAPPPAGETTGGAIPQVPGEPVPPVGE